MDILKDDLTINHCCIVSQPLLMRGFDYRCKDGIRLLIASKLDSARAYVQALGRVGRYTDPCERFKLSTVEVGYFEKSSTSLYGH